MSKDVNKTGLVIIESQVDGVCCVEVLFLSASKNTYTHCFALLHQFPADSLPSIGLFFIDCMKVVIIKAIVP